MFDIKAINELLRPYLAGQEITFDSKFFLQKELRFLEYNGKYVLYNTVLNNPFIIDKNTKDILHELENKSLRELAQDESKFELVNPLIS